MRDIFFAVIYLICAAVLAAFPAFLLFALFLERETQIVARERAPELQAEEATAVKAVATTAASADALPTIARPTWIAPTPEYNYDPSAIPVPSAAAVEAFAQEPPPVAKRKKRRARKPSVSRDAERRRPVAMDARAGIDAMASETRMGVVRTTADGRRVFDTPPIRPD